MRSGRHLRRGVLLFLLTLCALYLWITFHPPDLSRYAPEVSRFLSERTGMEIRFRGLTLRLGGTVALSCDDVAIYPHLQQGDPFTARQLLLRFSPIAWLMNTPPLETELVGMTLPIVREASGSFSVVGLVMGDDSASKPPPTRNMPFSTITVRDVRLLFVDETAMLAGEPLQMELERIQLNTLMSGEGRFEFEGRVEMRLTEGETQKLRTRGQRDAAGRWRMELNAEDLRLDAYRYYLAQTPPLSGVELPLSIQVEAQWGGGEESRIGWNLLAGEGHIFWPELFRWPLPVSALTATGSVSSGASHLWDLRVDHFDLLNEHGWGRGRFTLEGMGGGHTPILDLAAMAGGVPADKANFYYPTTIMTPDLVQWLDRSISQGVVREARALIHGPANNLFNLVPNPPDVGRSTFLIEGEVSGGSLEYYPGAPLLTDIETLLVFDGLSMEARVEQGRLAQSDQVQGYVRIADMMHAPVVEIQATAHAHLESLWHDLMEAPRLRLDRAIGMAGTHLIGDGELALNIELPLNHLSQVTYDGQVRIHQARLTLPFLPAPVESIRGTLNLNANHLTLNRGEGIIDGVPVVASLGVKDYRTPVQSRFHLTVDGAIPDDRLVDWIAPLLGEGGEIQGIAPLHLEIQRQPSAGMFQFSSRLDGSALAVHGRMGWKKSPDTDGAVTARGSIGPDGTLHLENLRARLGSLELDGAGALHTETGWTSLRFDPLRIGKNRGAVTLERTGAPWQINAHLSQLQITLPTDANEEEDEEDVWASAPVPPMFPIHASEHLWPVWPEANVEIHADRLLLAEGENGKDFRLLAEITPRKLRLKDLHFLLGAGRTELKGNLDWDHHPGNGPYQGKFQASSKDVGALLRALDFHSGMADGEGSLTLELEGEVPPGRDLLGALSGQGEVVVEKGTIRRLRLLSTLLGLLSLRDLPGLLTGHRPDLQGEGFYYKRLHGDFTLDKGVWKSDRLKLIGPSMTILAAGMVDYTREEMDLLVGMQPWQFLDRIVTQVPILGTLAGGSRESLLETQFDVTGSMEEPEIQIRPVSSLVPGILRDILQLPAKLLEQLMTGSNTPTGEAASVAPKPSEDATGTKRFNILNDPFQSQGENP